MSFFSFSVYLQYVYETFVRNPPNAPPDAAPDVPPDAPPNDITEDGTAASEEEAQSDEDVPTEYDDATAAADPALAELKTYILATIKSKEDTPTGDPPTGDMPYGDPPIADTPTGDPPTGDTPTGDIPYGDPPIADDALDDDLGYEEALQDPTSSMMPAPGPVESGDASTAEESGDARAAQENI